MFTDLRYAVRSALGSPGFATLTVLTFALATGAFATVFGTVEHLLIRSLPFPEADRIAFVGELTPENPRVSVTSYPILAHLRDESDLFEEMAIYNLWLPTLTGAGEPVRLDGQVVTWSYFDVLGIAPLLGRTFSPDDDVEGAARTAVISHRLWNNRFGSDPNVVGTDIAISGVVYTLIGVMPPDFEGPEGDRLNNAIDIWRASRGSWVQNGINGRFLRGVGRLSQEWDDGRIQSGIDRSSTRLREAHPDWATERSIEIVALQNHVTQPVRSLLLLTLVAVVAALAAVAANLTSVFLTRALKREPEFAIRSALGATKGRIYSLIVSENVLLGGIGALVGLVAAALVLPAAAGIGLESIPRAHSLEITLSTGLVAVATTLAIALLASLAVAPSARNVVGGGTRSIAGAPRGRKRFQSGLLVAQVGLSLALVAGSILLFRSFRSLTSVDLGFQPEGVIGVQLGLSGNSDEQEIMVDDVLREVGAIPGVEAVGVVGSFPQHGLNNFGIGFGVGTVTEETPQDSIIGGGAQYRHVGGDYLNAIGATLVEGRLFDPLDFRPDATPVLIVNDELASQYFPGESAIGHTVTLDVGSVEIVGVISHVAYGSPADAPAPELYVPRAHGISVALNTTFLTVRAAQLTPGLSTAIREVIHGVNPSMPVEIMSLEALLADTLAGPRFNLWFMSALAAIALAVALVGIFGVTANLVTHRTKEMGIRMALGATGSDVVRIVVSWGAWIALLGVLLGLALTLAGGRFVESLLFGVNAKDPTALVATVALLFGATLLASYLPARRASRADLTSTLRAD